jgi:hypothetical protein
MLLISVSKLDDARPAGDVEADLAAGVPRERELAIYFNALMESSEAKAGASRCRGEKVTLALLV